MSLGIAEQWTKGQAHVLCNRPYYKAEKDRLSCCRIERFSVRKSQDSPKECPVLGVNDEVRRDRSLPCRVRGGGDSFP